jgi:hypothetical protein
MALGVCAIISSSLRCADLVSPLKATALALKAGISEQMVANLGSKRIQVADAQRRSTGFLIWLQEKAAQKASLRFTEIGLAARSQIAELLDKGASFVRRLLPLKARSSLFRSQHL